MHVFVYGTLTDPDRASAVLDDYDYCGDAVLDGLHRVDAAYPTLAPGGSVRGRILATEEVAALDAYESVDSGLYVRVSVPLAATGSDAQTDTFETYVGDPELLEGAVVWPGNGRFEDRVRTFLADHDVRVVPDPDTG